MDDNDKPNASTIKTIFKKVIDWFHFVFSFKGITLIGALLGGVAGLYFAHETGSSYGYSLLGGLIIGYIAGAIFWLSAYVSSSWFT